MNVLIVDDAAPARKLLRLMLQTVAPEVSVVGEAENATVALEKISTLKPDAVFLDIEMPGLSGIQMMEKLIAENSDVPVVFTTAYNEFAIKAFRMSATDYLLKPIRENELNEAVHKLKAIIEQRSAQSKLDVLMRNLDSRDSGVLAVPVMSGYEYFSIADIEYLEADGSYVTLATIDGKLKTISKNLKYFSATLEQLPHFFRAHRSFLVNLRHMKEYQKSEGGALVMKSGKIIDIARDRRTEFLAALNEIGIG